MPSRRPPQVPKATAKSANNKRRAPRRRGQSERNQQWAMLTEDCGITLHAIIDTPVPEVFHQEVDTKRIWLLEGNWGEHANLQRWADDIASKGITTINARLYVSEIKVADWPAITDIMPAGLKLLSEEAWRAWTIALENIMNGRVTEGEAALRKARLIMS